MQHYELVIRTAHAGTSFFIRAEEHEEAVRRVVRIASSFETPEPARLELSCNGRPVACEALAAIAQQISPPPPEAAAVRATPKPSR